MTARAALLAGLASISGGCSSDEGAGGDDASAPFEDSLPTPDVTCSPPDGSFEGTLDVALSTALEGAEIRYTLDGSPPTSSSPLFDGTPLTLSETTQVRTRAHQGGMPSGASGSCLYVAREVFASSNLPLVVLDGYGGGKPTNKDVYRDVAVLVHEPKEGRASLSNAPTLVSRAGYHVRGQSSATFDKTPYRVELRDENGDDRDVTLLGMPADADWAFIGPFVDRALIRNAFVYSLGRDMGLEAPRFAFVELYLNHEGGPLGERHYQGVYLVVETIKNSKGRLDLAQLREGDVAPDVLSGGYIFKFDFAAAEEPTLPCVGSPPLSGGGFGMFGGGGTCWDDLEVVDPKPLIDAQGAALQGYVQALHDAIHEEPLGPWTDHADERSFVDNFIIQEFTRNMDAYIRSAYFFKDRGGKIFAGPLWDYNLTFDVGGSFNNRDIEGFQYAERGGTNDWFHVLAGEPAFMAAVGARYHALRDNLLSDAAVVRRIDELSAPLAEAAERDFRRWPTDEVRDSFFTFPEAETWEGQLDAMRTWSLARLAWLDSAL